MSSRATPARAHACRATGAIAVTAQRKAAGPSIRTAGQSPVGSALAVTQLGSWLIARGQEPSLPQATGPMPGRPPGPVRRPAATTPSGSSPAGGAEDLAGDLGRRFRPAQPVHERDHAGLGHQAYPGAMLGRKYRPAPVVLNTYSVLTLPTSSRRGRVLTTCSTSPGVTCAAIWSSALSVRRISRTRHAYSIAMHRTNNRSADDCLAAQLPRTRRPQVRVRPSSPRTDRAQPRLSQHRREDRMLMTGGHPAPHKAICGGGRGTDHRGSAPASAECATKTSGTPTQTRSGSSTSTRVSRWLSAATEPRSSTNLRDRGRRRCAGTRRRTRNDGSRQVPEVIAMPRTVHDILAHARDLMSAWAQHRRERGAAGCVAAGVRAAPVAPVAAAAQASGQ